jgi:enoyl-CoA hydratase
METATAERITQFAYFDIEIDAAAKTAWIYLNRPEVKNAMNGDFWKNLPLVVQALEQHPHVRVGIFMGRGGHFSSGLDLKDFYLAARETIHGQFADDREQLLTLIRNMQSGMQAVAHSSKVFIAAIQGYCIGAGLDLAAACDLRLCDATAVFSLREARVGIVADMGSLNRLPGIIGQGNTRLLAYTGRDVPGAQANEMGLVNALYVNGDELAAAAKALAAEIAANPAIAVRGTKHILNYMEGHGPDEGLDYVALYNAAFLDSKDFREVVLAFLEKRKPKFQ